MESSVHRARAERGAAAARRPARKGSLLFSLILLALAIIFCLLR